MAYGFQATSDAAGRAAFLSVPPGRYRLVATHCGRRVVRELVVGAAELELRLSL